MKTVQQVGTAEGGDFISTVQNIWAIEGILGFFKANLVRFVRGLRRLDFAAYRALHRPESSDPFPFRLLVIFSLFMALECITVSI